MTDTLTATQALTITDLDDLIDVLEDKFTVEDIKDTLYALLTEDGPVLVEHVDNDDEFWVVTREGNTFTVRKADERDH